MANGEECRTCGYQETSHILGTAVTEDGTRCFEFESTVLHKPDCPVLDCGGNCEKRIEVEQWKEELRLRSSVIVMLLPSGGMLIWGD